ncbi:hypothetical protein [Embleya hyalina]|uniref:Transposase n=1 Tax=Embleya hyalina TaxID=516124 RepID=A0A401Z4R6_9ACTN|nr:hypothetical protein [Embleya hyalina]GCE01839.1 transposase [Embleya hyalina]
MRWQAITERGIRIDHRTYDHEVPGPLRGQSSGIVARGGKWEVHHNPHDGRQVWVRLPDGELTEIPWIHRDHTHHPFDERTRRYVRATAGPHTDADIHEANLADALDRPMRRAHTGRATRAEQRLLACGTPTRTPHRHAPCTKDRSVPPSRGRARRASTNSTTVPMHPHCRGRTLR